MAVLLEALVQAIVGRETARQNGRVIRAAVTSAPFLILVAVYLVSR